MDEVDEAIVELLEVDGRLTHREIARAVGLSRSTAAARVQRLISRGQVVIRGAVHPAVLGRGALAHVSVLVDGPAAPVAAELARRDDVPFLSLTGGPHALVAEIRSASARDVDRAVAELRAIPGVSGVDTLIYVEVMRDVIGPVGDVQTEVDSTDLALLAALQEDGPPQAHVGGWCGWSRPRWFASARWCATPVRIGRARWDSAFGSPGNTTTSSPR